MMKKLGFLLIFVALTQQSSGVVDESFFLAKKIVKLLSTISTIRDSGKHVMTLANEIKKPASEDIRQLLQVTSEIDESFNRTVDVTRMDGFMKFVDQLPAGEQIALKQKLTEVSTLISRMKHQHDDLRRAITNTYTVDDWKLFSRSRLNGAAVASIRALNVVQDVVKYGNSSQSFVCGNGQTIKYYLVEMTKLIMATEARAVILLGYAFLMEDPSTHVWKQALPKAKQDYEDAFMKKAIDLLDYLIDAPDSSRSCDGTSGTWTRDKTYYEAEKLDQAVIFDYTINPFKKKSCNDLLDASYEKNYFNSYTSCKGELADCVYLGKIEACLAPENTTKRYEWVKGTAGDYGMHLDQCAGEKIESSWNYKLGHSSCICNCFEEENYVSTELITTDLANNMVVTGVRLIRKDRVLYIQPKTGKLLADGRIEAHSEFWAPLPVNGKKKVLGKENKAFFLDDLLAPYSNLVSGVGFLPNEVNGVQGFKLQLHTTEFDYTSGNLCMSERCSTTHHAERNESSPVTYEIKNSIYTNQTHVPDSANGTYVTLYRSSLPHDVGQSVVPLFDGVAVQTKPSSPLGGIGIFHKGAEGFAGFISLRMHALKYEENVRLFVEAYARRELKFTN